MNKHKFFLALILNNHPMLPNRVCFWLFLFLFPLFGASSVLAFTADEIMDLQPILENKSLGEKIAFWAEKFVGTPYDKDPQGAYVSRATVVADDRVDCMYLTFRAVELALSQSPEEAVQIALDKRFFSRGLLNAEGKVMNYADRFQYGEDMIESGKWGREITLDVGRTIQIKGSRGRKFFNTLAPAELLRRQKNLQSGDLLFFITPPEKRKVEEAVGHIGIIQTVGPSQGDEIFLIHASGRKKQGGVVKKVLLPDYVSQMPFVGVKITRLE